MYLIPDYYVLIPVLKSPGTCYKPNGNIFYFEGTAKSKVLIV